MDTGRPKRRTALAALGLKPGQRNGKVASAMNAVLGPRVKRTALKPDKAALGKHNRVCGASSGTGQGARRLKASKKPSQARTSHRQFADAT